MKIALGKLKNFNVYLSGSDEPLGVFSDAILEKYGRLTGYIIKSISIVPISYVVRLEDIENINDKKIILKRDAHPLSPDLFKREFESCLIYSSNIKKAMLSGTKPKKVKDMQYDFETGLICDVVIVKNILSGKEDVSVNKIYAKDNTIYISK